nr:venom polypeptide precursor [Doratifera vulnerans]
MLCSIQKIFLFFIFLYSIELSESTLPLNEEKCKYVFINFLDVDKNGKLEIGDLFAVLDVVAKYQGWPANGEAQKDGYKKMQMIMDGILEDSAAKDVGYITLDQWITACGKGTKATTPGQDSKVHWQELWRNLVFHSIDKNGDGYISTEEYISYFVAFGRDKNEAKICSEKLMQGKNSMSEAEFSNFWWEFFLSSDPHVLGNLLPATTKFMQKY